MLVKMSAISTAVLLAIAALATALISQYVFGLQPCILCIYQRYPYAAIIVLGMLFLAVPLLKPYFKIAFWLMVLLFLVDASIAVYHVAVEQKLIIMSVACDELAPVPDTIEAMREQLLQTKAVPCDEPQFVLFGLSMAAWNVLYALVSAWIVFRQKAKYALIKR